MEKITMVNINSKEYRFLESAYLLLTDYYAFIKRTIKENDKFEDTEIQISVLINMEMESRKTDLVNIEIMKEVITVMKENQNINYEPGKFNRTRYSKQKGQNQTDLKRDTENNIIGGVCSGIAKQLNIDPLIVRILFIAASFILGIFIGIYIILWIVLPKE